MLSRGRRWAASGDGWVGNGRGGALLVVVVVLFALLFAASPVWSGLEYYWIRLRVRL
jgi:hypothetical protein